MTDQQPSPAAAAARARVYSEDDEEIRKAKAYALAIQNNPNMTTDEIKQLLANEEQSQLVAEQKAATKKAAEEQQQQHPNKVIAGIQAAFHNIQDNIQQQAGGTTTNSGGGVSGSITTAGDDPFLRHNAGEGAPDQQVSERDNSSTSIGKEGRKTPTHHKPLSPRRPFANSKTVSNPKPPPVPLGAGAAAAAAAGGDASSPTNGMGTGGRGGSNTTIGSSGGTGGGGGDAGGGDGRQISSGQPKWTTTICESEHLGDDTIRLAAVLWKRRSGLGKLSVKHGWERRRVVLAGCRVMYYKGGDDDDDIDEDDNVNNTPAAAGSTLLAGGGEDSHGKRTSILTMIEQKKEEYEKKFITKKENKDDLPRGVLDLIQEKATVAASKGHSGAPTPFAISIKVRGETKWKFCFDSRPMQMEWLAALSDVVVISSVDSYNRALVEASDPAVADASHGTFFDAPTPSEPSAMNNDNKTRSAEASAGGHRLWMIQEYNLQSENYVDDEKVIDDHYDEDDDGTYYEEDEEYEEEEVVCETDKSRALAASQTTPSSYSRTPLILTDYNSWEMKGNNLFRMVVVVNMSLFYAHASTTNIDQFWYLLTFVNLALWLLLSEYKEQEERESFAVKRVSRRKKRRAVSSGDATALVNKDLVAVQQGKGHIKTKKRYKPMAGTTTLLLDDPQGSPWKDGQYFGAVCAPPGENLMIRSHGYLKSKVKVPSPGEMYKLAHVDIFESPSRYPEMATRVQLPKVDFGDNGIVKTWHAPDIFIISIALPTDPPKMTQTSNDGSGYTITMYLTMKEETRDILKRVTADGYDPSQEKIEDIQKSKVNAVKLLNEWCRRAPTDPKFQSRFKLVPNAQNLKEIGMPNWIAKYNGKPVLIKRPGQTGFTFPHPELNVFEFDISLHPFPYLAKQGICYMKQNFFKQVLVTFGFCIEGRADDELPECIIGLMQLCYPDPQYAIQAEDFFKGTSPRSF